MMCIIVDVNDTGLAYKIFKAALYPLEPGKRCFYFFLSNTQVISHCRGDDCIFYIVQTADLQTDIFYRPAPA